MTAIVLGGAVRAEAQACCAGGSALTPARLELHEDYAVGLETHVTSITGSFEPGGGYAGNLPGQNETDFEEDLLAAVRLFQRGQLSLLVPGIVTQRALTSQSGVGGGLGDINLGARWDFIEAAESRYWPGIAVLLGVTLPTGRTPEQATVSDPTASGLGALATNATGIGAFQLTGGIGFEKNFGDHVVTDLTALVSQRLPTDIEGVQETLGTQLFGIAGAGWAFEGGQGLAVSATFTGELDASVNGQRVPQSGKSETTLALSGLWPFGDDWRIQGSLFDELQVSGLGANQPIGFGLTFTLLRTWS